jgi:anti-sigma-K factor RskA
MDRQQAEAWEELLAGYVLGDLTPEEVVEVDRLLASRPELLEEVNSLQETMALIPFALPEASPSPTLRPQLLEQAQQQVQQEIVGAAISTPQQPRRIWLPNNTWLAILGGGVMTAIAIGLGFDSWQVRQELASTRSDLARYRDAVALLRQPNSRLLALKGMGATPTASGSITIAPSSQTATIAIQNLVPLPKGKVYRLWAVVNGQKVDCAEFTPDSQGKVLLQIPLDRFSTSMGTVAITIEPNQRTHEPTGEMVMTGNASI